MKMNRARRDWLAYFSLIACIFLLLAIFGLHEHYGRRLRRADREATLYRDVLAYSQTAVVVLDDHGLVRQWSDGAKEIFGWSKDEVVGYGIALLLPDDMKRVHREAFARAVTQGLSEVREIECQAQHKDGGLIEVVVRVWSADVDGQRLFVALINRRAEVQTLSLKEHQ